LPLKTIRVVAALISDGGAPPRYLVQQRLPGGSRADLWEFPGGKVEPGESDEAALARECREELAVELEVGPRRWVGRHAYHDVEVELVVHAATIRAGSPQALGAQALRSCTAEELVALPFCEADLPFLDVLLRGWP
jgi:8-oxo-dGTP diphosphatase